MKLFYTEMEGVCGLVWEIGCGGWFWFGRWEIRCGGSFPSLQARVEMRNKVWRKFPELAGEGGDGK